MSLYKNTAELLVEAARLECGDAEDLDLDKLEDDVDDTLGDDDEIAEIDDDETNYTEAVVPVFARKNDPTAYLVEMDCLAKYMIANNVTDIGEAVSNIAEHNQIDAAAISVVVESHEYVLDIVQEARKVKKELKAKQAENIKTTVDVIKMMKTRGIKVVKRKSKTKKDKRKK